MTHLINRFTFILAAFVICACSNHKIKRKENIAFRYSSGKTSIIPSIIDGSDTVFHGVGKYYYLDGKIEDEIGFFNGIKNGWHKHYDDSGNLAWQIMYENGLENGEALFYRTRNNIYRESYYLDGVLIYNKWVDEKGRITKYASMNDTLHFYAVSYDSLGRKEWERGYSFFLNPKFFSMPLDSIRVNKEVEFKIPIAAIPKYSILMEAAKFDSSGTMLGDPDTLALKDYYAVYRTKFKNVGKNQLVIAGELKNEKGIIVKADTMVMKINVID